METKEQIYVRNLNKRVKTESGKEIDHEHYLAIMDSMEEYKNQTDDVKGTVCPINYYEIELRQFECAGSNQCRDLCNSCLNYVGEPKQVEVDKSYLETHCPTGNFDPYHHVGECVGNDTCLLCKRCKNLTK